MTDEISLRQYVDMRFDEQAKALAAALSSQRAATAAELSSSKEAVAKAETATEKRFENSNEWRNTIETLQRTYMPRTESEGHWRTVDEKVDVLTSRIAAIEQRGRGRGDAWAYLVGGVGLVAAVIGIVFALTRGAS